MHVSGSSVASAGRSTSCRLSLHLGTWAYEVAYEWGALAKALVWQRGC